ncbi:MAG: cytochrome c oxidase accessory protein CcoG [Xanthomonadales bacterium]|nr:cytochrome c oxidase accessory protein CcoG [Xanthomonadales bacterium]
MYRKEPKIYPREAKGRFARLRKLAVWVLLGLFYVACWLQWDGQQAVLFDLPARKFHIFGLTLWPQDFIYLTGLLIVAGLSLFFFTALAGRLWCGFACPQTVWTEVFLMMEQWVEGDRNKRIKLDKAPWTARKIWKKSLKQFLWITFALWTGFTFVGYFTPVLELGPKILALDTGPWETFWVFFYGLATYGNAGFLREQVCKYMCPYARFQSAMFDKDTLIISYDEDRGEPRGKRKKNADLEALNLGSCVDCTLCVQVCPTGIDIRDGLQYECIACAACIDVCDEVMDKMNYPRGLIRYTTEHAVHGEPTKVVRPRTLIYATLLTLVTIALVVSVFNRTPLRMEVLRDRNALYRVVDPATVENVYTLKIVNMEDVDRNYTVSVEGPEGLRIDGDSTVEMKAGAAEAFVLRLRAPTELGTGRRDIRVSLETEGPDAISVHRDSTFFLPFN